jgi:hypothetical protein
MIMHNMVIEDNRSGGYDDDDNNADADDDDADDDNDADDDDDDDEEELAGVDVDADRDVELYRALMCSDTHVALRRDLIEHNWARRGNQ